MKALIVEDDFTSRLLLQELLKSYPKLVDAIDSHFKKQHPDLSWVGP